MDRTLLSLVEGKTDAEAAAFLNARPPIAKPSNVLTTYATYLSIGEMPSPFTASVAGQLRQGLLLWIAGPDLSQINAQLPSPAQLQVLHDRLSGYPGIDLSSAKAPGFLSLFVSGVPGVVSPLLTQEQANALLAIGYTLNQPVTEEQVASARAFVAAKSLVATRYNSAVDLIEQAERLGNSCPSQSALLAVLGAE